MTWGRTSDTIGRNAATCVSPFFVGNRDEFQAKHRFMDSVLKGWTDCYGTCYGTPLGAGNPPKRGVSDVSRTERGGYGGRETTAALLKEYKKLQVRLQMAAVSGTQPDNDDMQRFQGISALLFGKLEVSQYLLAEMRLQQEVAGILRIITDAADIDMGMGQ